MAKTNIVLKLLCLLAIVYFVVFSVKWAPKITNGFAGYYTFSRMLLSGEDLSKAYNEDYFESKIKDYGIDVHDIVTGNILTNSFTLIPFSWMDAETARIVWSIFSIASFLLSILVLFKLYNIKLYTETGLLILLITILWRPIYDNIAFGQIYTVLLLLFSLSLLGLRRNKSFLFTLPLSSVFLLKGYGAVNFIWLVIKRKWKELIYSIGFVLAGIAVSALILGISTWKDYVSSVISRMGQLPVMGHTAYQTINSLLIHLFIFDTKWLPHPVISLPYSFAFALSICLSLLFIAYILFEGKTDTQFLPLSFSAAIAAGVVTAPIAEEYHYVLFLPLIIGMSKYLIEQYKENRRFGLREFFFLAAVFVMIIPLNYKSLQFSSAPQYLLAYPKLYAGIILLIIYRHMVRLQSENI
jgi:hypothetical protein